jgi:HD-GYP domain-containing protein (c-di-GMP phosphodiesterase class II)
VFDLSTPDINPLLRDASALEGFVSYFGVPLVAKDEVKGVLEIYLRRPFIPDQDWFNFLDTVAGSAAIAIDEAQLFQELRLSNMELQRAYDATIEAFSNAMGDRDKETFDHMRDVTELSLIMAAQLGVSEDDMVHVQRGAVMHDIGKLGVPDKVLQKEGPLDENEWVLMKKHPENAYNWLKHIEFLQPALDIPYCHHEKWDGTGYPRGLKGEDIPLAARIFAVVDVWQALTSDRIYRKAWSKEKALTHIKSSSGTHFDPRVVEVFVRTIELEEKMI